MRVYVVIGVYGGVINEVRGSCDRTMADEELADLQRRYGIILGQEEESEHAVELYEMDIEFMPASVMARRRIW